jgi:hypothetical protein
LRPFVDGARERRRRKGVGAATRTPRPVQSFSVPGRSPGSPLDRDSSGLPEDPRPQ